ncbi:hypothetical protein BJ322DRAFT_78158 [Thelephora terrestris]|uniref:No apical meristem-associated C-terminal domain-containing protein n=1 Tax=Thelephora terrestris TaxID=56493 RepID=A0A9P6LCW1_9AGAM|nr:hypothetical protein BJ322DRAFT_78158 [Thelephora terrestris]
MDSQRGKTSNEGVMAVKKKSQPAEESQAKRILVRWSEDLVFKLLNKIEDDPEIQQGLYPRTGASGAGKPKNEFYWKLATYLFADHEEYGTIFAEAQRSSKKKDRELWGLKVRNKLNSMADEVKRHDTALDEIWQGFASKEKLNESLGEFCLLFVHHRMARHLMVTYFLPKAQVEKVCPWYSRMKRILEERPNVEPVGTASNTSELDLVMLASSTEDDSCSLGDTEPVTTSDDSDDDDEDKDPWGGDGFRVTNKRSASAAGLDEDMMTARLEDLAKIAVAEEATRQKELDLRIQRSKEKSIRTQMKAELQKAAIEAKREKTKLTHEREIMKLQLEFARTYQAARAQDANAAAYSRTTQPLQQYNA